MLKIIVPETEWFNSATNEFITMKPQELLLEHSLLSISKWESKWEKPFLNKTERTSKEILDYIRCMTITQNVKPETYLSLSQDNIDQIIKYIDSPNSATTFREDNTPGSREIITSEIIYYWMISYHIPVEFEKWHLNRLLNLIKICSIKNQPPKKMSKSQIMSRNRALNEARKAQLNTKG